MSHNAKVLLIAGLGVLLWAEYVRRYSASAYQQPTRWATHNPWDPERA